MAIDTKIKQLNRKTLSNSHPAIVKLKEGRVFDVATEEITHPRISHFYMQERLLFNSLGEKYEDCIKRLLRTTNPSDLEIYMNTVETEYREFLTKRGCQQEDASQIAHDISKAMRKVWYRTKTDFDTIEEIHDQRVSYIQELGNYLNTIPHMRKKIDLMLIIKDVAMWTDGWESDIDLAFSFNVKDSKTARSIAINALAPLIRKFEAAQHENRPKQTAHIDWENQAYATTWLYSMSKQLPLSEKLFDGIRTNTYTRGFLTKYIFGVQDNTIISLPIYPPSRKEIYGELMENFTQHIHNKPVLANGQLEREIYILPPTPSRLVAGVKK